jgi:hypothetical protein
MELRKKLGAAALLAAAAMATAAGCGGRDTDEPNPTPDAGCTGVCSTDAGTDAGTTTDAGTDAGTTTDAGSNVPSSVAAIRKSPFGTRGVLTNVVITGIEYEKLSDQNNTSWRSRFWVVDPLKPTEGIFVEKFYDDTPADYHPQIGDVIDIEGYFGTESNFEQFRGRRQRVANDFRNTKAPLRITVKTAGGGVAARPPDNEVTPENLAASQNFVQADAGYLGSRVHVQGPLELTNAKPTAFMRVDKTDAGSVYYGYELTGGVLINHENTRDLSDGGVRCDYQAIVNDGGTVSFPNGVRGVFDTYTFAACEDGGTDIFNCRRNDGKVPGTTPEKNYIYVIHPENCADLGGQVAQ